MGAALVAVTKTPTILATETLPPKRNIAATVAKTRGSEAKAREVAIVVHCGAFSFGSLSGNVPCTASLPC
jgi:hypothetical protein